MKKCGVARSNVTGASAPSRLLAIAVALSFAGQAPAQSISGSLAGSVVDSSGAVVSVAVKLANEETGLERTGLTEANSDFVFPGLVPGRYTIRVEARRFRPYERKGSVVLTGQQLVVGAIALHGRPR